MFRSSRILALLARASASEEPVSSSWLPEEDSVDIVRVIFTVSSPSPRSPRVKCKRYLNTVAFILVGGALYVSRLRLTFLRTSFISLFIHQSFTLVRGLYALV